MCGYSGHGSSFEERKQKCPAFEKKCNSCSKIGHFSSVCRNKSINNVSENNDASSIASFGVFFNIEENVNPIEEGKMSHKVCDRFGRWMPGILESHSKIEVNVKVCKDAYVQLGLRIPFESTRVVRRDSPKEAFQTNDKKKVKLEALPDTGAQMVVAGIGIVQKVGLREADLIKPALSIKAANSEEMKLLGAVFLTISGENKRTGEKRESNNLVYIASNVSEFFLSKNCYGTLDL